MRSRSWILAACAGVLAGVLAGGLVQRPAAAQSSRSPGIPRTYLYYPGGSGRGPELFDTRTGATYLRNGATNTWEPHMKPVSPE